MTDAEIDQRVIRSRQALWQWRHEASFPWADRPMTRTIAETEIGVLRDLSASAPEKKRPKIAALIEQWNELRLRLMD